jgi:hypothetical protein
MTNYRSLVPGGFYSKDPADKSVPVAIRMNNPGAINGAAWLRAYPGYVSEITTSTSTVGGKTVPNKSTIFETPEHGVAVWYELMRKYRTAGATTVAKIITRYGGGQNYSGYIADVTKRTGLHADYEIKLTGDDENLLKFAKAMFRHEAGRDTPLMDSQIRYGFTLGRNAGATPASPGSVVSPAPPAPAPQDWGWLVESIKAIAQALGQLFKKPTPQTQAAEPKVTAPDGLIGWVVRAMQAKGYHLSTGKGEVNIAYVEGMGPNGLKNNDKANEFNDVRLAFDFVGGQARLLGAWDATTEPGTDYTHSPINAKGCARIAFGQYRGVWVVGMHNGNHEGLLQRGGHVTVHRDYNKDFIRTGDALDTGMFGINQHHAYGDRPYDSVGPASAGCLVGRTVGGHEMFMRLVKSDPRYLSNRNYAFDTTVLSADDF